MRYQLLDTLQLQRQLRASHWRDAFDPRTLQRADDYCRKNRVVTLDHQQGEDSDTLAGTVRGSRPQPYRCSVTIRVQPGGNQVTYRSQCDCPVGHACKHAASLLITAAQTPRELWPDPNSSLEQAERELRSALDRIATNSRQSAAPPAASDDLLAQWDRWLTSTQDLHMPQAMPAEAQRQLGLLLRSDDRREGLPRLLLRPVWMRPTKSRTRSDTLVDPQDLYLDESAGPEPAPQEGWPADVESALAVVLGSQEVPLRGNYWTPIDAPFQERALVILLAHYPAFLERGSRPLSLDQPRPLHFFWQDQPNGNQTLCAGIEGEPQAQLLRGAGLWYLLGEQRRFGQIEGDAALAEAAIDAPPVPPEQVEGLRQRLSQPGAPALPLPQPRDPPRKVDGALTPVLHLRSERSIRHRGISQPGCAHLYFDYAGVRVDAWPQASTARQLQDGHVIEIQRDAAAEAKVRELLAANGLIEIGWYANQYGLSQDKVGEHELLLRPDARKQPLEADDWAPVIDKLAASGVRFEYDKSFPHDIVVEIDEWHADIASDGSSWFDIALGIDVDGKRLDVLPLLRRALADPDFPLAPRKGEKKNATWRIALDDSRSVAIPLTRLRALIEPLLEWLQGNDNELRLHRTRADTLRDMGDAADLVWHGGDVLRKQLELLHDAPRSAHEPKGFGTTLRPYQREGLAWLNFLADAHLGGILADDMGLGKTVQVLAHILNEKQLGRLEQPALIVAPTSLVGNWQSEAARFTPQLKVLVLHGADRADRYEHIADHDLVITTYPLLPRDQEKLCEAKFSLLVLDEAQAIKNARSQAAQVVRELPVKRRLAMTGTPLENHLGELWAQFDAVEPGLLGSQRQFTKLYRTPIEKHADSDRQQRLNQRVGALLLRRRKQDVLTDLPPKTEIVRTLELESGQRSLYETLRLAQHVRVQDAVRERGLGQSGIIVLDALLKLRQVCCDPRLVKLDSARKVKESAKLDALLELLDGLLAEGRRILLFSQFTEMLGLIEQALKKRGIAWQSLTGQTPSNQRATLVDRFQNGDVPLFLISLKAGGLGLNLTAADTVIHYDPWWNPAVEAQATDRAHRIGQDKPVFVYRLICAGTVEEKIQALQTRKADLAQAVLEGGGASQRLRFDEADLAELFAPL